jgi:hypothetical protein
MHLSDSRGCRSGSALHRGALLFSPEKPVPTASDYGRCRFGEETFGGTRRNWQAASLAATYRDFLDAAKLLLFRGEHEVRGFLVSGKGDVDPLSPEGCPIKVRELR